MAAKSTRRRRNSASTRRRKSGSKRGRRRQRRRSGGGSNIAQLTSHSGKTVGQLVNELNSVANRLGKLVSSTAATGVGAVQDVAQEGLQQQQQPSDLRRYAQQAA